MALFTHLRVRSSFSPGWGAIRPSDLVAWAQQNGARHICVTDHESTHGSWELQKAADKAGLTLIHGAETPDGLVIATSEVGLKHLWRVVSGDSSALDGLALISEDPPVDSPYPETYQEVRLDRPALYTSSYPRLPTVAASYARPDDRIDLLLLEAIRTGRKLESVVEADGAHLWSTTEVEAVAKADDLANLEYFLLSTEWPHLDPTPNLWPFVADAEERLRAETRELLGARFTQGIPPTYADRLDYELDVIITKGYASYFLVMSELTDWCRQQGILTNTRGSAAGSLTAYAMRITGLDPLRHGLMFERFLNPDRPSAPDIDLDVSRSRRQDVIEHLRDRWGADHVAQIATLGTFNARGSIRDVVRVTGKSYTLGEMLSDLIPKSVMGREMSLADCLDPDSPRGAEAAAFRELVEGDPDAQEVVGYAQRLHGLTRQLGVHAAGVIVCAPPLAEVAPLTSGDPPVLQWPFQDADKAGLLKMDVLGLRNLDVVAHCLASLENPPDPDELPLDDPQVYRELAAGNSIGVFQLDGVGMRGLVKEMAPSRFEDLPALVALYRPGPMSVGSHLAYARRSRGAPVEPLHPDLEKETSELLSKTYGLIVYQEDVLALASELAGYSRGEADVLRKAMGKKLLKVMEEQKEVFSAGMLQRGYSQDAVDAVWGAIEGNASYGFNKCTSGDTVVDSIGNTKSGLKTATSFRRTIKQIYERLHGRGDALPGQCRYCRDDHPPARMANSTLCRPCRSWREKVRHQGLIVPGFSREGEVTPVRVSDVISTGQREVWRVTLVDGRSIDATNDHRHLTPQGWRKVGGLRVGDSLIAHKVQPNGTRLVESVEIVSIEPKGVTDTYDLEVDSEHHSWSANGGIFTHNSHATSYGHLAYVEAWLKVHHPAEFMAALITWSSDDQDRLRVYLREARRLGLEVLGPSVARSGLHCRPEGRAIRLGLNGIKQVGLPVAKALAEQPAPGGSTLFDWLAVSAPFSAVNKRVVSALNKAGALDCFGLSRLAIEAHLGVLLPAARAARLAMDAGLPCPFPEGLAGAPPLDEAPDEVVLAQEREALGLWVSHHPADQYADLLEQLGGTPLEVALAAPERTRVCVVGVTMEVVERKAKKSGQTWATALISDGLVDLEVLIFPNGWQQLPSPPRIGELVRVEGRVVRKFEVGVAADALGVISSRAFESITIKPRRITQKLLAGLGEILTEQEGGAPLRLVESGRMHVFEVSPTATNLLKIAALVGWKNVILN